MSQTIFVTAESALNYIQSTAIDVERFELAIKDGMTLGGQVDITGAGMAIVLDEMLAHGYEPDGYEQHDGYRSYFYRPMD